MSEQEGIKSVCLCERVSVKVRVCYRESELEGDIFCDVGHGELVIVQKRKKTNKRNKKTLKDKQAITDTTLKSNSD